MIFDDHTLPLEPVGRLRRVPSREIAATGIAAELAFFCIHD
jgi:hypothetical protein